MKGNEAEKILRLRCIFYPAGLALIFLMKRYYSTADVSQLLWILRPTAGWVRFLTGAAFELDPAAGYVSHSLRFIIAPSCSGVQFLMIAAAALLFSYLHCFKTIKGCCAWAIACVPLAYASTVFVNGIRIALSILLPPYILSAAGSGGGLSPERLHSMIGITVYFTSLLLLHGLVGMLLDRSISVRTRRLKTPILWYFFITLGLPFLNRMAQHRMEGFGAYALFLTLFCAGILAVLCVLSSVYHRLHRKIE